MSSQAVHDFCNAVRETEALRAQRKVETRQATEARRSAEQLLIETLGVGAKAKITVDGEPYLVRVYNKDTYSTCGSSVVERMSALWQNIDTLRTRIEGSSCDDIVEACASILFHQAGITTRSRSTLQVNPLKEGKTPNNFDTLQGAHADVASALIRAKAELARGREEHREELKRCSLRGQEAEANIIQELSQLELGQVKRVNMLDGDGTSTSYYLRLKKARQPPKRKITVKVLRMHIKNVLNNTLNPLLVDESMDKFCSTSFAQEFIKDLKEALQKHELQTKSTDPTAPKQRVALDKLRGNQK